MTFVNIAIYILLIASNLIVFLVQRTTISNLKTRNKELERTNNASLNLTQTHSESLKTLKEIINPNDIGFYVAVKVEKEVSEILKNVEGMVAKTLNDEIANQYFEIAFFLYFLLEDKFKLTIEQRDETLKRNLKGTSNILIEHFHKWDARRIDTQKNQTPTPTS